jgi:hypothetical protein
LLTDHVRAGVALQRLWLTTAALGLHLQPEMTPLIFRWYVRSKRSFSKYPAISHRALKLTTDFESFASKTADERLSFFCRIGHSREVFSRSVRRSLDKLMVE